jgi:hypothetical protein
MTFDSGSDSLRTLSASGNTFGVEISFRIVIVIQVKYFRPAPATKTPPSRDRRARLKF